MSAKLKQGIARAAAAWCLVFLVVLAGRPSFTNASLPVRGVSDPVVALQTARNAEDVEAVIGDAPSADREVMRVKQYVDFGLIAGYLLPAMIIAAALSARRYRLAIFFAGAATLAAAADFREDWLTLRIVDLKLSQLTPSTLEMLRVTSVAKWIFFSLGMLPLSGILVRKRGWYPRAAGLMGLTGVALTAIGLFYPPVLAWGGLFMSAGLLLTAVTLKELTHEPSS